MFLRTDNRAVRRARFEQQWCGLVLAAFCLLKAVPALADCSSSVSGITGWWPGDGSANDIVGTNNGTFQGGASNTLSGFVGQAFAFDGASAYVQIPDSPSLRPTNLTVEAWVKFNSLTAQTIGGAGLYEQVIVYKQNSGDSAAEAFYLGKSGNTGHENSFSLQVNSPTGGSETVLYSTTIAVTNVWYHLAGVRGSNYTQLYVNGTLQAQTNINYPQDYGAHPLLFGTTAQSWDARLAATLDEVSLYNRALSSNEIAAIYAAGSAGKCKAPNIILQPQSIAVVAGSNAALSVSATGFGVLNYQWQFNNTNLPGATAPTLSLTNVQSAHGGNYRVIITNTLGSATSLVAGLTIWFPPSFTSQPLSATNLTGTSTSFSAAASGNPPPAYQWQFNGAALSGATSSTLSLQNVQLTNAGNYSVVASNAAGALTSSVAVLTVWAPPNFTSQPSSITNVASTTAMFTVTALGTQPLSYQWQFNGIPVPGATGANFSIPNVQATNAGPYTVVITNVASAVTSTVAVLTVLTAPVVIAPPQSATNIAGTTASFTVAAAGAQPLSFQWLFNGIPLPGATASNLALLNVQSTNAGYYQVTITNIAGFATSEVASLVVLVPPSVPSPPLSQSLPLRAYPSCLNISCGSLTLSATATGTLPLSYQWQYNGSNLANGGRLSGATTNALVISGPQQSDAGSYALVVSNSAGVTTSAVATLTFTSPLFHDLNLEDAVRTALGRPAGPLVCSDLLVLTNLQAFESHITDLSGLECAANLISLHLGGNSITDLSPLRNLLQLRSLSLYNNHGTLSDVSPIVGLKSLAYLDLRSNPSITNLSALSGLNGLTNLFLGGNPSEDLSFLTNLVQLTFVDLDNDSLTDVSFLAGLPALTGLDIGYNPLNNIAQLGSLSHLTTLYASGITFTNLAFVQNLRQLSSLYLCNAGISDISLLTNLNSISSLNLGRNSIADYSPIASLTNLSSLWLYGNSITNLAFVPGLPRLANLVLDDNRIFDPSLLPASLITLSLARNALTSCAGLSQLNKLVSLELSGNLITSVSGLGSLSRLTSLGLSANQITDISPLTPLVNLTSLDLSFNPVGNPVNLAQLTNLVALSLGGDGLGNISFVTNLNRLSFLSVWNNQLADISPLLALPNLSAVDLGYNPAANWSLLSGMPGLSSLGLEGNSLADLSFVQNLTALQSLDLSSNLLVNVSQLSSLTNLHVVNAGNNLLNDISGLQCLPRLWGVDLRVDLLDLSQNSVVSAVAGCLGNRGASVVAIPQNQPPVLSFATLPVVSGSLYWAIQATVASALAFTVKDDDTPAGQILVTASSSNPALLPNSGLELSGAGGNLTLKATPAFNQTGMATITLTATDNAGLSSTATLLVTVVSPQNINIPDPNLRSAVLKQLAIPAVTNIAFLQLTVLYANDLGISNLAGLQFATNLNHIFLDDNSITNISLLQNLTHLTALTLSGNSIGDLSPLAGLTNLTYLDVSDNAVTDYAAGLSNLTKLTSLYLDDDGITNLAFVQNMPGLRYLSLSGNRISDLSPLAGLTNLAVLSLQHNLVTNISVLTNMPHLVWVDLSLNLLDLSAGSAAQIIIQSLPAQVVTQPQRQPPQILLPLSWLLSENRTSYLYFGVRDNAGPFTNFASIGSGSLTPGLIPAGNLTLSQFTNAFVTPFLLTVTPLSSQTGFATLTLSATNDAGLGATTYIVVNVVAPLALDNTLLNSGNLSWLTGGDAPWFGQTNTSDDGVSAAQSGSIMDNQESWIQTTVIGPGTLTYWWKVSSESRFDRLQFYINGVLQTNNSISGEIDWQQKGWNLPQGPQALRWRFFKDPADRAGSDAAWLDQVSFISTGGFIGFLGRPSNGSAQFLLWGIPGRTYEVLASSNLVNWVALPPPVIAPTNLAVPFTDTNATTPSRFYRLRQD